MNDNMNERLTKGESTKEQVYTLKDKRTRDKTTERRKGRKDD